MILSKDTTLSDNDLSDGCDFKFDVSELKLEIQILAIALDIVLATK